MTNTFIASPPASFIGWDTSDQLKDQVSQINPSRILVVTDPVLVELHVIDFLFEDIHSTGIPFDTYTDIIPEPTLETGNNLIAFARKKDYQLIIGIGGGSVLDLSKLAAVFTQNDGPLEDYLNLTGTRKIVRKGIPKILIPTTSGTGSETTNISVLSLDKTKDVVSHEYLKADLAIVDPKLTLSLPPSVTAATGVDALTHAIEAFVSVNANPYSDGLALEAVRMIGRALERAVMDGSNRQARTDMSHGSYLAGLAFSQAGVGAVHALAYPIGGQFHIAHGASNAVMLPYVFSYIHKKCASKLTDILQALGESVSDRDEMHAAVRCVEKLTALVRGIGIPGTLAEFQIPGSAIKGLAADGIKQKRLLSRCPVSLDEDDIFSIYQAAYEGQLFL